MSKDKNFHARISSYELTVLELLTAEERSAYLDNIAEAVKIYDHLQLEYPTEEDKERTTLEPDVKKLTDMYRENTERELSHKKLVRTVGSTLYWMRGGSDTDAYAHAKKITSFPSYLERIRPYELINCMHDSRGLVNMSSVLTTYSLPIMIICPTLEKLPGINRCALHLIVQLFLFIHVIF